MKSLYRLFILFICPTIMWAQPAITLDIAPEIGDTWEVTFLEPNAFSPGPSGANQTWDFSNINLDNTVNFNFEIVSPADVLGNSNFPTADFVWYIPGFEIYEFYEIENDGISLLGGVSISENEIDFLTIYTDVEDGLPIPLNYQDSHNYYSVFEQYFFGSLLATNDRTGTTTADGYGTLTTPNGTYTNVLRVKIQETSFGFTNTQYAWYDVNNWTPLFVYEESGDPETPPSLYFSEPMIIDDTQEAFALSANWEAWYSASEHKIMADLSTLENINVADFQITDIQGRIIASFSDVQVTDASSPTSFILPQAVNGQVLFLSIHTNGLVSSKKIFAVRK